MTDPTRQSTYRARRVDAGARQKSFLLSAETVETLRRLSVVYGSETKAVTALILGVPSEGPWREDFEEAPDRVCAAVPYGSRWSFHHAHWDDQQEAWLDIHSDRILNPRYWRLLPTAP